MEPFSSTLQNTSEFTPEELAELDTILNNQVALSSQEDLTNFLPTLPTHLKKHSTKVEIYLRHKYLITYSIDRMQALRLYAEIKPHFGKREQKELDPYFMGEKNEDLDVIKLITTIGRLSIKKPHTAFACSNLLQFLSEDIVIAEEPVPSDNISA